MQEADDEQAIEDIKTKGLVQVGGDFIIGLATVKPNNFFSGIFKSIKKIDKDSNGFVTIEELDEIFREWYPLETEGKTMNRYLKKVYGSVSNRNLINYKQLKSDMLAKVQLATADSSKGLAEIKRSLTVTKQRVDDEDDLSMLKIEGMQPMGGVLEQPRPRKLLQISDPKGAGGLALDTISMRSVTPMHMN